MRSTLPAEVSPIVDTLTDGETTAVHRGARETPLGADLPPCTCPPDAQECRCKRAGALARMHLAQR